MLPITSGDLAELAMASKRTYEYTLNPIECSTISKSWFKTDFMYLGTI